MDLVAISVSHRTAPLHPRERLALSADGATQAELLRHVRVRAG